jgi:hypothetical protein
LEELEALERQQASEQQEREEQEAQERAAARAILEEKENKEKRIRDIQERKEEILRARERQKEEEEKIKSAIANHTKLNSFLTGKAVMDDIVLNLQEARKRRELAVASTASPPGAVSSNKKVDEKEATANDMGTVYGGKTRENKDKPPPPLTEAQKESATLMKEAETGKGKQRVLRRIYLVDYDEPSGDSK